jgi:DNA segregation ATPase FtsK/SpoIIIE, S-DNA-T family
MRRVVTGEQVARLYNPDPFARPVWRAPVYITPAGIIVLVQLSRLLAWIVRMAARHPITATTAAVLAFVWVSLGWVAAVALIVWAVLMLAIWRWYWPSSFTCWVTAPARGKWRAWWCYRRRWEAVMNVADLAPGTGAAS